MSQTEEERIKAIRKKIKTNRSFRKKLEWYNLGQRRCHCCGIQLHWGSTGSDQEASVEHMVPVSHGGTYDRPNILIVCRKCNRARGNKSWMQWIDSNDFPKKEWLLNKYLTAVEFYKSNPKKCRKGKSHKSVFKELKLYQDGKKVLHSIQIEF